jgi:hypothetical protein
MEAITEPVAILRDGRAQVRATSTGCGFCLLRDLFESVIRVGTRAVRA